MGPSSSKYASIDVFRYEIPQMTILSLGQRYIKHSPIDIDYKYIKRKSFTRSVTLQGPRPYLQINVRYQPDSSAIKKQGGSQHPRPVLPTKSGRPISGEH